MKWSNITFPKVIVKATINSSKHQLRFHTVSTAHSSQRSIQHMHGFTRLAFDLFSLPAQCFLPFLGARVLFNAQSCRLWSSTSLSESRWTLEQSGLWVMYKQQGLVLQNASSPFISLLHRVLWHRHDRCSLVKCFQVWQLGLHLTTLCRHVHTSTLQYTHIQQQHYKYSMITHNQNWL